MSAHIASDNMINQIITWLADDWRLHHYLGNPALSEFPRYSISKTSEQIRLATDLHNMNVEAVNQGYPHLDPVDKLPDSSFLLSPNACSKMKAFKSLQYLLYQCNEGNVDETPLFKLMNLTLCMMAVDFVAGMPEYEKVKWGED